MLILLLAFALVPLVLPVLVARWGSRVFLVAAVVPIVAFVHTAMQTPRVLAGDIPFETYVWIPDLQVQLSMRMDVLAWVMALIVTGVGALVMIYCRWYFAGKKEGLATFSAVLLAFAGAMYGLVLTDDIVVLIMLWEVTSVLSYLLIGFYHRRGASRRSALQALLVTTLGGLVMLIGVVMLVVLYGTTSITAMIEAGPIFEGGEAVALNAAIVMLLVGALSKSAIFPFHFWLPGAMAAPTPVSAYLHAAAMVKAGIYLIARFAPGFAETEPWRPIVLALGLFTMLLGGLQALRESDLKRVLAFGTVSQLGMLTVVLGYGERNSALAGLALLVGHALFKSSLFLIVGVIDRQLNTRDITELSGVGRQAPTLATFSIIAIASMVGVAPTVGFVAKEATLTSFLEGGTDAAALFPLIGIVLGSALTAAYGIRFVWGAFWTKKDAAGTAKERTEWPDPPLGFLVAPILLSGLTIVAGVASPLLDVALTGYADTIPLDEGGKPYHLALWHGWEPALFLSIGSILLGAALFWVFQRMRWTRRLLPFTANDAYNVSLRGIARLSVWTTSLTQRGSLPFYVGTIFVVFIAAEVTALAAAGPAWKVAFDAWQSPAQLIAAPIMILAGFVAVRARKRYTGVVLVSVTGLGMVLLFATSGAPDLALTQILVETVTLIAFALVLRRIPARLGDHNASVLPVVRAVLGIGVGVTMAAIALIATGARVADPISDPFPGLAYDIGHGRNVVNVTLVDLRGWDTMGELSVLILAATGVASLVFVTNRADSLSSLPALPNRSRVRRPLVETAEGPRPRSAAPESTRQTWLLGGLKVKPENRSLMLEVIVRVLFHSIIVVSFYLLFAGHNLPGGGFAGGLVAGMALVMRYVAGGRFELGVAAPTDAGRLLGAGMTLALACAIVPLFFGAAPLTSTFWEAEIPLFGHVEFVTSTIFDVGVYLVVIGLVLDVLRSLGAEVDRQTQAHRERVGA
ncbi:Na+/H+ antiporter subunit A [Microbacterium sp. EYE_5]|uniref:Na+/H+ antiporter subunit A n=1 Tax=unclassified Microbacterium TaxID=2609290 RepID=UPI00200306A9|nr:MULTISPECIES: Na+/H+ antiporter subunit A [unclassified Microbacterium]MCK6079621.1 Na+/H+ antiporter subunit A [Microbacterium sp. EYE_382]MCK6084892.1 Na+/H+ antiporter subunit A [Microbacterium sp. EYE_384]MCK6122882.1 Na+/H+ antiporter subunit A [Microbacterium sp. EYE_80]MCK6125655.1 Na+/H+ antiporter subunit A [Microbacterium sp. EYE_79]MCK6140576.1 Na+/H+ antiporter subunit A [Microbacterium sp. EYE_39]